MSDHNGNVVEFQAPDQIEDPMTELLRTGGSVVFRSKLVPPYVRRAKRVDAALPWLYLKGISTGRMAEALEVLVGPEAAGLRAPGQGRRGSAIQGRNRGD